MRWMMSWLDLVSSRQLSCKQIQLNSSSISSHQCDRYLTHLYVSKYIFCSYNENKNMICLIFNNPIPSFFCEGFGEKWVSTGNCTGSWWQSSWFTCYEINGEKRIHFQLLWSSSEYESSPSQTQLGYSPQYIYQDSEPVVCFAKQV